MAPAAMVEEREEGVTEAERAVAARVAEAVGARVAARAAARAGEAEVMEEAVPPLRASTRVPTGLRYRGPLHRCWCSKRMRPVCSLRRR